MNAPRISVRSITTFEDCTIVVSTESKVFTFRGSDSFHLRMEVDQVVNDRSEEILIRDGAPKHRKRGRK